jgi:hypothetical protein
MERGDSEMPTEAESAAIKKRTYTKREALAKIQEHKRLADNAVRDICNDLLPEGVETLRDIKEYARVVEELRYEFTNYTKFLKRIMLSFYLRGRKLYPDFFV